MNDHALEKIKRHFADRIGLNSNGITNDIWKRLVANRMAKAQISTYEDYYELVINSLEETNELIELLIVPETWFFRDKLALQQIIYEIKKGNLKPPLNILCLACSTGEEPFSIAMTLFEIGLFSFQFHIDAYDISKVGLSKAIAGRYSSASFRDKSMLAYKKRFFTQVGGCFSIDARVNRQVSFYQANITDPNFKPQRSNYNIIFCRNFLIYMTESARKVIFRHIKNALDPQGLIFFGPAEIFLAQKFHYILRGDPKAYCFTPKESGFKEVHAEPQETLLSNQKGEEETEFDRAKRLADAGLFDEAATICFTSLEKFGANPKILFLLGVIFHAKGEEDKAEEFFLKTLYLEPNDQDTLFFLALLADKKGDKGQTEMYKNRLKRLLQPT